MSDYNHIGLEGRLTKAAEMTKTAEGLTIVSFSIATNRSRKKKGRDEWESVPSFIRLKLFGKRAESLFPYLARGQHILVEGFLQQTSWDKDGERQSRLEVCVTDIHLLGYSNKKTEQIPETEVPFDADITDECSNIPTELF